MNFKAIGLFIIVVGFAMTIYTGFNFQTRDKLLDFGGIQIMKDKEHTINWSPLIGIGAVIVGSVVFFSGSRKTKRINTN